MISIKNKCNMSQISAQVPVTNEWMHAYSNMLQALWIIYNAYNKTCGACMIIYKWDGDLKLFEFLKNIVTLCNKKQWTQSLKNETNKYVHVPLPVHCRRHLIVSVIKVHPIVYI